MENLLGNLGAAREISAEQRRAPEKLGSRARPTEPVRQSENAAILIENNKGLLFIVLGQGLVFPRQTSQLTPHIRPSVY